MPEASRMWRVRARLADEPGALAALAAHLGRHGCNLLSVAVLPVAGDQLLVRTPVTSSTSWCSARRRP